MIFPTALPKYPGPFPVGAIDLEVPASPVRDFGGSKIETVLVKLYYPADKTGVKGDGVGIPWIPAPFREYLQGLAMYMGVKYTWLHLPARLIGISSVKLSLSCSRDAPLLDPTTTSTSTASGDPSTTPAPPPSRWPVIMFSHGMGGTRNAYSQFCGSLASYGCVVAALEHRDNSASRSRVCVPAEAEEGGKKGKDVKFVDYLSFGDDAPEGAAEAKRRQQVPHRGEEVRQAVELLRSLDEGGGISTVEPLSAAATRVVGEMKGRLDLRDRLVMAGHSFGSITSITSILSQPRIPYRCAILLDPWMEILSMIPGYEESLPIPALSIISQGFFKWKSNYSEVISFLRSSSHKTPSRGDVEAYWIPGSAHLQQSDFSLVFPALTKKAFKAEKDPVEVMRLNVAKSVEFLRKHGILPVAQGAGLEGMDGLEGISLDG